MIDLHIDGLSTFSGGEYNRVTVDGTGTCSGNLVCEYISVDGTCAVEGDAAASNVSIDGSTAIKGNLSVDEKLSVDGSLSVKGTLRTNTLRVDGSLSVNAELYAENISTDGSVSVQSDTYSHEMHVDGAYHTGGLLESQKITIDGALSCRDLRAGTVRCDGKLSVLNSFYAADAHIDGILESSGNIEAETFCAEGYVTAHGQISADKVEIYGMVHADEIVGDRILIDLDTRPRSIRRIAKFFETLMNKKPEEKKLCANLIEATTIELTGVTAVTVSGENITIGPDCCIEHLECSGKYSIDGSSTVRTINGEPYMP